MTAKVLSILFSLLILVCPFNCMPESEAGVDSTTKSCCSHCQPQSEQAPLAPSSDSECCQCLCSGAIQEQAPQLDDAAMIICWIDRTLPGLYSPAQHCELELQTLPSEPVLLYGRALRCQQMSFQC